MFRFGEVEAALQKMHKIAPEKEKAFRSRLRNFRRAGLHIGVGAGPGPKASISAGDAVITALAVELGQLGNSPERCVAILQTHSADLKAAVAGALSNVEAIVLFFLPVAWSELENVGMPLKTLAWAPLPELAQHFQSYMSGGLRSAVINLSYVVSELIAELGGDEKIDELQADLLAWATGGED